MNQYTKARMEGLTPDDDAWPQQKPHRRQDPERARGLIDVDKIIETLMDVVGDDDESTANRLSASKTLLDKSLSTLSTVDSTVRTESESLDEAGLKARLRNMLEQRPDLVAAVLGEPTVSPDEKKGGPKAA